MAKYITECKLTVYKSERAGRIAIVTMDNGQMNKKPITWSDEALDSLGGVLDQVEADPDFTGWILTGNAWFFNAGADIMSVNLSATWEEALMEGQKGHTVFKRIMDLDIPTVAAINGIALGGGLESTLYHDYRTVSGTQGSRGKFAFPECYMGLIPGWGGTQLVPRIAGPEAAVELIIKNPLMGNRMVKPDRLLEIGLVDQLYAPEKFLEDTINFLEDIITGKGDIKKQIANPRMSEAQYNDALEFIKKIVHSGAKAPYDALALIEEADKTTLEQGFVKENEALARMLISPQFKASIYSFDLIQRRSKKMSGRFSHLETRKINKIGVVGSGSEGCDLALLFLQRFKVTVVLQDMDQVGIEKAVQYIQGQLFKNKEKGLLSLTEVNKLANDCLKGTLSFDTLKDCDVVIETVSENMSKKQELFHQLESVCSPDCLFLTTTSFLDITQMASVLQYPSRLAGFHPIPPLFARPLVEIVKSKETSQLALATSFSIANNVKKVPVLVEDSPGFLVGRLLSAMVEGGMTCLEKGACFEQVEKANLDLGFPIGSMGVWQSSGASAMLNMLKTMADVWPERFNGREGLQRIVAQKKNMIFIPSDRQITLDPEVADIWPRGNVCLTDNEINEIVMTRLAVEIDCLLNEGVVESYKDVDTAMLLGAGWPFFNGGITGLLDHNGYSEKVLGRKFMVMN
ncbi:3-hydroxyacyl-CoA dehydrogenase NAD-binding domain-containing protein [Desulfobacula sp.]|uniref:3-hydroxyacyl-CoA dehydrogenase NAD-binding domain-containing protein n=1 Tax=Desulfobacula sp. TaxID=2593537 RepID=UPI0026256D80|nr:3-hydroxyacyl-CoA dehydrogenase NAD-binding domain-containing protein [Desulfobacula sp.]